MDSVDAFWVAHLLRINRRTPSQIYKAVSPKPRELGCLRSTSADRIGHLTREINPSALVLQQYESLFSRFFLQVSSRPLQEETSTGTPLDLNLAELAKIPRKAGRCRFSQYKAQQIIDRTICPSSTQHHDAEHRCALEDNEPGQKSAMEIVSRS